MNETLLLKNFPCVIPQLPVPELEQGYKLDPFFNNLFNSEKVVGLAEKLLGSRVIGENMQWFNKPPKIGKATPPHQDGYYFMLEPNEALTMWVALDEVDESNGCVRYIPGSNKKGIRPHQKTGTLGFSQGIVNYGIEDKQNEVPMILKPGDLLVHHSCTIHRADGNTSNRTRKGLGFIFYSVNAKEDLFQKALQLLRLTYVLFLLLTLFGFSVFLLQENPALLKFNIDTSSNDTWRPKSIQNDLPAGKRGELVAYGYRLIKNTSKLIGPGASDCNTLYAGNQLLCNNCHLKGGRKIGSRSFVGVAKRFPQFRGRENKIGTLKERINGCMERSMNGQTLPPDSREMKAMIAYMERLSKGVRKICRNYKRGIWKLIFLKSGPIP